MSQHSHTTDTLRKSHDCIGFALDNLRESIKTASAVEFIVIMDVIESAQAAMNKLGQLISARDA